jgi:hypothetical protein
LADVKGPARLTFLSFDRAQPLWATPLRRPTTLAVWTTPTSVRDCAPHESLMAMHVARSCSASTPSRK